mmetsp:Transcript_15618/g.24238  ORF Transcript_15618/g.24238 Transcript_15618/m.24238 type:complete len:351 (-) Transcript_15618:111-1163(-)
MPSSYRASRAARSSSAKKTEEGMLEPLLSEEDDDESTTASGSSESSVSTEFEAYKPTFTQKLKQAIVNVFLTGGVGVSAAAMILSPAIIIFVAGGICIANVPYAIYKERELKKIPTLRSMNNKLREDANHLEESVDQLVQEMNILEPEADRASKVEGKLRKQANKQHVNVDKLLGLVKENDQVLVDMRHNLRKRIIQDITAIVIKSDKDNDETINKKEAKELSLKIRLQLQAYDVGFDTEKFAKVVAKDPSLQGVLNIVLRLLPKEENEEEVDKSKRYYDYSSDSDEEEEEYDMFFMGVSAASTGGSGGASVFSAASGIGVSLMKADKRRMSSSKALLKRRMSVVGTFGS